MLDDRFKPFYNNATITQANGDSGDSCQRVGTYLFLNWILGKKSATEYTHLTYALQSTRGRFRRSPDVNHWGSRPSNLSRDQLSVMRLALSAYGDKTFNITYWKQFLRLGFHQNFLRGTDDPDECWKIPDVMTPEELTCFIRHNRIWILYPLVFCLDLLLLLFLLYRDPNSWDADNMHAQKLYYSILFMNTPVANIAFGLYAKTNYLERIDNYYALENNGIPPMAELYREADKKMREYLCDNYWYMRFFFRS